MFSSDRYKQLENGAAVVEGDEAIGPIWVQEFDSLSYDFFGRGYDPLFARFGSEAEAEAVIIEIDSAVIGLALTALDRMNPRPPFYLLFAHVIRHLILQKLPQWWGVNSTLHGARGRLLALAQRIGESLYTVRMSVEFRELMEDSAVQVAEAWVKAIQQVSDRFTGTLFDLTPFLLEAAKNVISIDEVAGFAAHLAGILGGRLNWDRGAGEEWIDIHVDQVFCRIRVGFRFMFATPSIPAQAVAFAETHGFVVLTVQDFDAPVFMLSTDHSQSLFGMGHLHLLLDTRAFSVSDLWFATV